MPRKAPGQLTALAVSRSRMAGMYGDGGGLWLQVTKSQARSWTFRFTLHGRSREMGLGPLDTVSLAEAREKATACRKLVLDGIDPIDARKATRSAATEIASKSLTFDQCASRYIEAHKAGWRSAKHGDQWKATLDTYASPTIGKMAVGAVEVGHVMKILEPIWSTKTETASRVRGRIESILDWATARGFRKGDNPARWKGHLDALLPRRAKVAPVEHHPALPYDQIATFLRAVQKQEGAGALALQFTILTAARTSEVVGARWSEFDVEQKVWTVPGERMKSGREHRVPLSSAALAILEAMKPLRDERQPFVFPGARRGKPLSNMAMLAVLKRMKRTDLTTHGFRSTFRDWASETTGHPSEVVEMALAHIVSDKVEAAYRRGDLFQKRRDLMAEWAVFCSLQSDACEKV